MTPPMNRSVVRAMPVVLPLVGLLILLQANSSLRNRDLSIGVAVLLAIGLAAWIAALGADREPVASDARGIGPGSGALVVRWPCISICAATAVGAYLWASDNTFRTSGVICWIAAVGAWLLAWWPADFDHWRTAPARLVRWFGARKDEPARTVAWRDIAVFGLVVAAIAVGAFFRFHRIGETPLDPTSDHAEKLLDVTDLLNGQRPIFFIRNTGREPEQFYLTFALIRLFDLATSFTTLKIGTALIGTVTIPFVFLLAREFAGRTAGIIAVWFFAVGAWPTEISRAGLRFPLAPAAAAPALWFLLRWMRTRDRRDALLCGVCIGIGLHGYTPFRVVVPAICLGLLIAILEPARRNQWRQGIADSVLIGVTAGLVFLPLGRYAIEHPDMFWSRSAGRLTGDENGGSAIAALIDNLSVFARNNLNAALGFNWWGDSTFVNAVTFTPILDVVTGALLIAGMLVLIAQIIQRRDLRALYVLLALPILLLSSTLAVSFPGENPSVNREGPVAPFIYAILALPLALIVRRAGALLGARIALALLAPLIAILVGTSALRNYDEYFRDFDRQTRESVANTTEIARAIAGAKSVGITPENAYIVDRAYWLDLRNIGIALGDIEWGFTHNIAVDDPLPAPLPNQPLLLVVNGNDDVRLPEIERTYPDARIVPYPVAIPDHAFTLVWVPPNETE